MMKRAVLLALVVSSNALVAAQVAGGQAATPDVTRVTGGVTLSTDENVQISADTAEYNQRTGEIGLFGTVILRQQHRPLNQVIPATNRAGAPFPEPKPVLMRVRGDFQISIGDMTVRADEADINAATGETHLRGNVKVTRPK